MNGSGAWQVLVSCSRHLESSLWCVADALVYGLHSFFRWFLGLSSLLGSWMDGVAGNTQLLLLCEHKTFTSPRRAAKGYVFNIHPTSNAQQAHRLEVSCLGGTVKFILSQLRFRDEGGGESKGSNGCRGIGS